MKILTVNINKGGTGKTTFAHNFAEFLSQHYRVLLVDFDDSMNLTERYHINLVKENTIISLFDHQYVEPVYIHHQLDLIASFSGVDTLKERQNTRRRREYSLGQWLANHYAALQKQYDYVIIDTENDEGILTMNALIVSDVVVGIAEPSKDAVKALASLNYFVTELNHEFHATATVLYLGNRINFSENSSKEFIAVLKQQSEYVGYLPRRTTIANEVSIFDNPQVDNDLKQHVIAVFERIKGILDSHE